VSGEPNEARQDSDRALRLTGVGRLLAATENVTRDLRGEGETWRGRS
jgi:hypothetical protein